MFGPNGNQMPVWLAAILPIIIIWSLIWKGIALWKSARNNDLVWYIILLILNTAGILEIIYIFAVAKNKKNKVIEEGN
ncbi:MAG: DUF5652 family protein [Candidatus Berkelbacteria bacterium]|nr:DUF5652 family protein [Candidatus Berkelbacteria bacterium]